MCKLSIDELRISNYRKFLEENFKLNPRMNVFAGKNGSGKTTVLEAACVSLGAYSFLTSLKAMPILNLLCRSQMGL